MQSSLYHSNQSNVTNTHTTTTTSSSSLRSRFLSSDYWSPLKNWPLIMQRTSFKINDDHILNLAIKARLENRECGYLYRRCGSNQDSSSSSSAKWQLKWFILYQNLLFYYENVNATKPQGLYLLETCYSARVAPKNNKDGEKL
ncbi:unnamed protein product, partial [Didymodactylos carnosus]